MIKITIIIILILLLIITLYSYYCLSSRMINFERARLEHILLKENELKEKENKIKIVSDCSNKNMQLEKALANINDILKNTGLANTLCEKEENNNKNKIIKGIENVIDGKIDVNLVSNPEQSLKNCFINQNNQNNQDNKDNQVVPVEEEDIYNEIMTEVPSEFIV